MAKVARTGVNDGGCVGVRLRPAAVVQTRGDGQPFTRGRRRQRVLHVSRVNAANAVPEDAGNNERKYDNPGAPLIHVMLSANLARAVPGGQPRHNDSPRRDASPERARARNGVTQLDTMPSPRLARASHTGMIVRALRGAGYYSASMTSTRRSWAQLVSFVPVASSSPREVVVA